MSSNKDIITISLSLMNPPRRIPLELPSPAPSSTLHKLVSDATTIPLGSIRLIFRGKMIPSIEEGNVIDTYKLEDGCVVHCMGKPATTSANTSAATSTSATSGNSIGSVVTPPSATAGDVAAAPVASTNSNQSQNQPLTVALEGMKANHSISEYTTALNTISKILSNIISNPNEEKYRKVKRSNPAFTKRLGRLTNSHDAMTSIGFLSTKSSDGNDEYSLVPNAEAWTKLTACKKFIDEMIQTNNQQNAPATNPNNIMGANQDLGFGAIPPTNNDMFPNNTNLGGGRGSFPPPSQMIENMLSNPAALQSMLSNPMIQNMVMNDPRMRNNPMMQNSMREMMNNPSMVQQMTQMMSDPGIRSRMTSMMQQQQQLGGTGLGSNNSGGGNSNATPDMAAQMEMMRQFAASMSNTNNQTHQNSSGSTSNQPVNTSNSQQQPPQQQQQQNNGSNNDGERQMTEEEMIAEAIARSLREQ